MTFFAIPPYFYKTFVKKRSGGQKKQTFCKKAQWRAKKLRERGSNTARPPKKGGGGLPIGSRFGRFGRFRRVDSVAICRLPLGVSCQFGRFGRFRRVDSVNFGRDLQTSSWRFVPIVSRFGVPVVPIWTAACVAIRSIRSRFADFILAFRADCVASRRDLRTSFWRFVPIWTAACVASRRKPRRKHKKSPIPQSGNWAQLLQGVALLTCC